MARQSVPTNIPDALVFPPGAHVKITNVGTQVVFISDDATSLFAVDPNSNTPLSGMPLSPDKTETWWGPPALFVRAAIPGGEIEYSFSNEQSAIPLNGYMPDSSNAPPPGTLRYSLWSLARKFLPLGILLFAFSFTIYAQTQNQAFPQNSPLRLGLNVIQAPGQFPPGGGGGPQTFYWSWFENPNETNEKIIVGLSGGFLTAESQVVNDLIGTPTGVITLASDCTFSQVAGFESAEVISCAPSLTGARQLALTFTVQGFFFIEVVSSETSPMTAFPSPCSNSPRGNFTGQGTFSFSACSPTDIGMNLIALPASGTTALSNIIDTRGVHALNLNGSCTQAVSINITIYDEDGVTGFQAFNASTASGTVFILHMSSEEMLTSNLLSSANALPGGDFALELPQRAIAFSFSNSTAIAGTCTARLFLAY